MNARPDYAFAPVDGLVGRQVDAAWRAFGTSCLSEREGEVLRLILRGLSSKEVARVLGNSPETVKVFRKRIQTKLGLGSTGEAFGLFLAALCAMPADFDGDPLIHLPRNSRAQ